MMEMNGLTPNRVSFVEDPPRGEKSPLPVFPSWFRGGVADLVPPSYMEIFLAILRIWIP